MMKFLANPFQALAVLRASHELKFRDLQDAYGIHGQRCGTGELALKKEERPCA
jgi:hypothetical protein